MKKYLLLLILQVYFVNIIYAQSITRDANNRITQVQYMEYTILYTYGSNGERLSREIVKKSSKPLPVNLSQFTAKKIANKKQALLEWTTTSEKNSSYFLVEHSLNKLNFQALGSVKATAESNVPRSYSYIHLNPNPGINYYRLQIVDKDSSRAKTPPKSLVFDFEKDVVISVYPNPTIWQTTLQIQGVNKGVKIDISISDVAGRLVFSRIANAQELTFKQVINTTRWPVGSYLVRVNIQGRIYGVQFVVSH